MFNTTVNTKFFGLLGSPLSQSAAPFMQNSVYQKLGMDCLYVPLEIDMMRRLENYRFTGRVIQTRDDDRVFACTQQPVAK